MKKKNIQIPVVIDHRVGSCDIFIPDLSLTVHGDDYVDAIANAILVSSATYYYNIERNHELDLKTTFEQACDKCELDSQFVTYVALLP